MGLSASQARLLSLSNRQHAVENKAQALQQRKMLLANNQDKAYKTYLNALNNTVIKTIQTNNETGAKIWINGTINNLLRNGTASNTSGNVFYVQDLKTGQLYLPKELIYNIVDPDVDGGYTEDGYTPKSYMYSGETERKNLTNAISEVRGETLDEQARSFANQFGITYTQVDVYEEIKTNYEEARSAGWDLLLGAATETENDEILAAYEKAVEKDKFNYVLANNILEYIPDKNKYGIYEYYTESNSLMGSYANHARQILETYATNNYISEDCPYSNDELELIRASLDLMDCLEQYFPQDFQITNSDSDTQGSSNEIYNQYMQLYPNSAIINIKYALNNISVTAPNERVYINQGYDNLTSEDSAGQKILDDYQRYLILLNGGTLTWTGSEDRYIDPFGYDYKNDQITYTKEYDVYTQLGSHNKTTTYADLLGRLGYSSFGEALTEIFTRVSMSTSAEDEFLASRTCYVTRPGTYGSNPSAYTDPQITYSNTGGDKATLNNPTTQVEVIKGIFTRADVEKYKKYKTYKEQWLQYEASPKVYEYIPSDKTKAQYYEQLYKALVSCGVNNVTEEDIEEATTEAELMKAYAKKGFIKCEDYRCENSSWVSNMIQNAQVILTTWDSKNEMLSKTAPALITKLKQVSDSENVEKASQEYEAELDLIKQKDNKYDVVLNQLETERNALQTEIDALEDVIKHNINKHFKVFG